MTSLLPALIPSLLPALMPALARARWLLRAFLPLLLLLLLLLLLAILLYHLIIGNPQSHIVPIWRRYSCPISPRCAERVQDPNMSQAAFQDIYDLLAKHSAISLSILPSGGVQRKCILRVVADW